MAIVDDKRGRIVCRQVETALNRFESRYFVSRRNKRGKLDATPQQKRTLSRALRVLEGK